MLHTLYTSASYDLLIFALQKNNSSARTTGCPGGRSKGEQRGGVPPSSGRTT